MDKLAQRLREDAERIDVELSPELQRRIEASLHATPQQGRKAAPRRQTTLRWWASGLTGAALAVVVLVVVDMQQGEPPPAARVVPPLQEFATQFDWQPRTAVFTQTLHQELADIESDLKKAERAVMDDLAGATLQPKPSKQMQQPGSEPF